jgi:hypothetical protein
VKPILPNAKSSFETVEQEQISLEKEPGDLNLRQLPVTMGSILRHASPLGGLLLF